MRDLEKEAESLPDYQFLVAVGRTRPLVVGSRVAAAAEESVLGPASSVLKAEEVEEAV